MDAEDLREVISAYQKCVADTVQRFDGFVAKYMGDGVLVYFGYPQAHEDDAERAVRAGAVLQTRVGIATGLVGEPLSEPAVHRSKQFARLLDLALRAPEAREREARAPQDDAQ